MTRTLSQPQTHHRPSAATVRIVGVGTARPAGSLAQADAARLAEQRCCDTPDESQWLHRVYQSAAVCRRGTVLLSAESAEYDAFYPPRHNVADPGPGIGSRMQAYARHAPPLAASAARAALKAGAIEAGAVHHLITVSCTGFAAPGLDIGLIDAMRLSPGVGRTAIGFMGCHGAINGLRVASALAREQPGRPVLLCAVELCSLHFQYGFDRQRIVANALFADGAAACLVQADPPDATPPTPAAWSIIDIATHLVPNSREMMTWTIGDHGFRMTLSPRVPVLIQRHLRPWLENWLAGHGLTVADIEQWAVHPGGPSVLDAVVSALDLPGATMDASRLVLAEDGNMSSPTVLFILDRLRKTNRGGPCVTLAFGPGLTAEAALLMPTSADQPTPP